MKAIIKYETFFAKNSETFDIEMSCLQRLNKFLSENVVDIVNIETINRIKTDPTGYFDNPSVEFMAFRLWYRQD